MISPCAIVYDRNYNRIGLQPYAPSRLPVKKLRRLLHKGRKVKGIFMKEYLKNIISYYSSALIINSQPPRRGVRSHSVLFIFLVALENVENDLGEAETS